MKPARVPDKRIILDRRMRGFSSYTGPERRHLKYRRSGEASICIYCGKICGDSKGWQDSSVNDPAVEARRGICVACASKKCSGAPLPAKHPRLKR